MKIAILLSGEYRTFSECAESMIFLNDPAVDVYFSTWSTSTYNIDFLNIHETTAITPEHISNYILGKDVTINIADVPADKTGTIDRMINRWVTGMDMIIKSEIVYDYIFILRPDLYFIKPIYEICQDVETHIEKDIFYMIESNGFEQQKLTDLYMISTPDVLTKIINSDLVTNWTTASNLSQEWHHWWYTYVNTRCCLKELLMKNTNLTFVNLLRMPIISGSVIKNETVEHTEAVDGWTLLQTNTRERVIQWDNIRVMDSILKSSIKSNLFFNPVQLKSALNWYIDQFHAIKSIFLKNVILISNRGNTWHENGSETENEPNFVAAALERFNVKIDVWMVDNEFYLGNDNPQYKIDESFLLNNRLWCQARNNEALIAMQTMNVLNCFSYNENNSIITPSGFTWVSVNNQSKKSLRPKIIFMPEDLFHINTKVAGICCNYVELLCD